VTRFVSVRAIVTYLSVAALAAVFYAWLGASVSHVPPAGIDIAGRTLAGEAPRLALVFTESCWWFVLVGLAVVVIALAVRVPAWRSRAVYALITTLVTWQVSDALKNVFRRPRPDYWRLIHEPSFSYSSGHAMFALLVYWTWAWFVWNSDLPRTVRYTLAPLLALWGCGVIWSRLALGAHYVTDLIGGLLLATAALAIASALGNLWHARVEAARRRNAQTAGRAVRSA
jgi:membrane-associated phospholipid phosphatase